MDMRRLLRTIFSFTGRANRALWWKVFLGTWALFLIPPFMFLLVDQGAGAILSQDRLAPGAWNWPQLLAAIILIIVVIIWIIGSIMIIGSVAITTRRLHDLGRSGWLQAWVFVPAAVILQQELVREMGTPIFLFLWFVTFGIIFWLLIQLGFLKGDSGTNRYGPDPLAPTASSDSDSPVETPAGEFRPSTGPT